MRWSAAEDVWHSGHPACASSSEWHWFWFLPMAVASEHRLGCFHESSFNQDTSLFLSYNIEVISYITYNIYNTEVISHDIRDSGPNPSDSSIPFPHRRLPLVCFAIPRAWLCPWGQRWLCAISTFSDKKKDWEKGSRSTFPFKSTIQKVHKPFCSYGLLTGIKIYTFVWRWLGKM